MTFRVLSVLSLFLSYVLLGSAQNCAENCGSQAGGALCSESLCCSQWGWCGTTVDHCEIKNGCQSQCWDEDGHGSGCGEGGGLADLITREMFEQMLLHRNDSRCRPPGFHTYDAFIEAATCFPEFASTGDTATRLREIAAFLGQTSHETSGGGGGWNPPDGPYAWGYCFSVEQDPPSNYCDNQNPRYPCVPCRQYYGRGPMQLSWNYNYGPCGEHLGLNLLSSPDLILRNPIDSFKSAFWFWMTTQLPKPSCHDVITGAWSPSSNDLAAGRVPGYGVLTNIINGGLECGRGWDSRVESRIGFYKRYCDMLGVSYGDNLDCYNQRPFGTGLSVAEM